MLLEQWRRYTAYFGMRRCDVPSPRLLPGSSGSDTDTDGDNATVTVRAELTFQGSFTPTALALVFPAVLNDPELTQELLGKDFSADAVFHLHFNKAGQLVRHDVDTDFFTVLAMALGDPVRAAEIMQVVGVAEESMLADPVDVDASEEEDEEATGTAARFLEPVERVAQAKRSRFAVVVTDDESDRADDTDHVEETRIVSRARPSVEPDAEPVSSASSSNTPSTPVDARLSVDFLLS